MQNDPHPNEPNKIVPSADEDNARTEDTKRVAEDYVSGLREMPHKLRKWFNIS
jgi:hypothetical protein